METTKPKKLAIVQDYHLVKILSIKKSHLEEMHTLQWPEGRELNWSEIKVVGRYQQWVVLWLATHKVAKITMDRFFQYAIAPTIEGCDASTIRAHYSVFITDHKN